MSNISLRVRASSTDPWITNFIRGGWKVRKYDNSGYLQMTQANTRIRNSDNTGWLIPT